MQYHCSDRWYYEPNGWTCQAAVPVAPPGASSAAHAHPDSGRRSSALVQQGYALTTMRQIADNAEVSERTAYLAFPSKLDLFMEVIGVATAGDDQPIPIAERPEFQSALSERTARDPLGLLVSMVTNLNERSGALVMAAHESAGADEALYARL